MDIKKDIFHLIFAEIFVGIIVVGMIIFHIPFVSASDIEVGLPAIDRDTSGSGDYTIILKSNPASATGTINHIEIYGAGSTTVEVASFTEVSTNNFTTRGSSGSLSISAGLNVFDAPGDFTEFDIAEGDYIGIFGDDIERTLSGSEVVWYRAGDNIPCENSGFTADYVTSYSLNASGESSGAVYELNITNPTTESPLSVSDGDNISIYFNYTYPDNTTYITSGVTMGSVYIGTNLTDIVTYFGMNGSEAIQTPTSCNDGSYINTIEAYSNWTIPGSGDINATGFYLYQRDTTLATNENFTIQFYNSSGSILSGKNVTLNGTGAIGWTYAEFSEKFTLTRGNSYWIGMLLYNNFNLARDENGNCADYLPNQGTRYNLPGDGAFDASIPATASSHHYGIFGISYETYGDIQEYGFITNVGWQVNVTAPSGLSGLQDLFVNATYNEQTRNDTQTGAINYGAEACWVQLIDGSYYVPSGCTCYYPGASDYLNISKFNCYT